MFPFATTRNAETEYSLLSPSAKRKKMQLLKSSNDKSEHNSSVEDITVTEQDNVCINCYKNIFCTFIDKSTFLHFRDLILHNTARKHQNQFLM